MNKIARAISAAINTKRKYLTFILCLLSLLFLISLFKNISYPLFWADESMTVMGGVRVLEYGYPKVHDGKNVFYDLKHPDISLGIDKGTDAYIGGASWGQYYIAALGVRLAELSEDIYTRTAMIRCLFAAFGTAGLILLGLIGMRFFHSPSAKTGFLTLFIFLELISIPLVLHLREARYYSLTIFIEAFIIYIYAKRVILGEMSYLRYVILLGLSLVVLFIVFSPAYFIFVIALFAYEALALLGRLLARAMPPSDHSTASPDGLRLMLRTHMLRPVPVILSLLAVFPLTVFFKTFYIAEEMKKYNLELLGYHCSRDVSV